MSRFSDPSFCYSHSIIEFFKHNRPKYQRQVYLFRCSLELMQCYLRAANDKTILFGNQKLFVKKEPIPSPQKINKPSKGRHSEYIELNHTVWVYSCNNFCHLESQTLVFARNSGQQQAVG